jgi:cytoskeletal protein CcmA (bactofilin family)
VIELKRISRASGIGAIAVTLVAVITLLAVAFGIAREPVRPVEAQGEPVRVAFDQDMVIDQDEIVNGDVSVTNGDLSVYGTVNGKVSVVNGEANIYGKVLGDVAVFAGGGVTLYPGSSVDGNILSSSDIELRKGSSVGGSVTSVGGTVNQERGATVKGSINRMDNPAEALQNLVQPNKPQPGGTGGSFDGGPFARIAGIFSIGILSVLILLLSVGLTAAIPNRVRTASSTLQAGPGPSIVVGIITAFLIPPAAALIAAVLAISVVGIVLLPVLAIGLLAVFLLGFVVVAHWLGKHLHDSTRPGAVAHLPFQSATLMVEVLLGVAVILASTLIPIAFLPAWMSVLMFLLVYGIACIGIGAVILSRLGTLAPPRHVYPHRIVYPTQAHNHYGSTLPHTPQTQMAAMASSEHTNTRPLGPTPALPRSEEG